MFVNKKEVNNLIEKKYTCIKDISFNVKIVKIIVFFNTKYLFTIYYYKLLQLAPRRCTLSFLHCNISSNQSNYFNWSLNI